ncbi:MAG: phytoene/squalene synthase family protein [Rhizobiaceae bacterium]
MNAEQQHAMEIVREADRDRYLSVLFAPEGKRGALCSLYAFNAEVARIRDIIHEPLPGEIRLQWWRDVIEDGAPEAAAGHPVAAALLETIRTYDLPRAAFGNYLDARIFDLYDDPMPSRNDLEGYCGETASALIQMASLVLDPGKAQDFAVAAGHAGCAQAMTGLLRLLPIHLSRGQCFVPRDLLSAAGTTPEAFIAREDGVAAARAIDAMIALAGEHFSAFQRETKTLPAGLRPAYLPATLAGRYLSRLSGGKVDPMREIADIPELRRYWTVFRHAMWGWR